MSVSQSTTKPEKPYPEFPLFPHTRGQWVKKFRGKQYSCGTWYDENGKSNHVAALARWNEIRNRLELGAAPQRKSSDQITTDRLVNLYLDAKNAKVEVGDLSKATFNQYKLVCRWLKDNLGEHRLVESLEPIDFVTLRSKFPKEWRTTTIKNQIVLIRSIFRWAYEAGLLDRPVRYGDNFSKPKPKRVKAEKAKSHKKEFTAQEFWTLFKHAPPQIRAWMLLGLNAGYGNSDLSRLKVARATGEWLDVIRGKTSEPRRCWLWPETRRAIKTVLKNHDGGELLFQSMFGQPLVAEDGTRDAVTGEFKKLREACKVDRKGVSFYALRHMTETIGGQCPGVPNVQVVVDFIMGHKDDSMGGVYRESIPDASIKKVCQHIRNWIMDAKPSRLRV
ncbi:tyrosine-type recombinase/integrase [Roseiconus lacunae]|uniref:Core-binding (CB) domain-containing protein n=1 Tax=Roseiconus lacunae TaxID=2605694 RepID=A0ABT7PDP3_9BACT|nr:hypothetical protein [Roseiconus lacunae]MDM4014615.1 hypothetical protein [Roseiconus lacunae]